MTVTNWWFSLYLRLVSYHSDMRQFRRWKPPKKFLSVVFAALVMVGVVALPPYVRAKRSEHWPTTDGKISGNQLKVIYNPKRRMHFYHAEVEYRYRVGSKDYVSSQIAFGADGYGSQREAEQTLGRYPIRSAVNVYYDPTDPSFAIMQPGRNPDMELLYKLDLWFIGVFSLAFVANALWYHDTPKASTRVQPVTRASS